MPEMKNQFTGGKMNKDLDERLVPNGEYRDAMNIQVATSEGSDVGTAQNILGNSMIPMPSFAPKGGLPYTFDMADNSVCVGAISDEKNDVMYYLVWASNGDYIFQWDGNFDTDLKFVFADIDKTCLKFTKDMTITGINVIDDMLFWTDNVNEPRKINIPRCIRGTDGNTQTRLFSDVTSSFSEMKEKHITVIKKAPQFAPDMKLHTSRELNKIYTAVMNISSAADFFNVDNDFSIDPGNFPNTTLGDSEDWRDFSPATPEEDSNEFFVDIRKALNSSGDEIDINSLASLTGWYGDNPSLINKSVVLQAFEEDGTPPGLPLTDFVVKGEITFAQDITLNTGEEIGRLGIKITSINGFPPLAESGQSRKYAIDIYDDQERLFEFKYPRFSYRYKYEDGEYSPFAPFTQVAFVPGSFDFHPKKGYNIGMTNKLIKVELLNIITQETPKDVIAIDILFKDDVSPSIYVVDTIKPDDYSLPGTLNLWDGMLESSAEPYNSLVSFVIEKEAISSIVPSNQLLRPWDNVPRKALAQDVSGNRIVYANYVQNYDLLSQINNKKYVPRFSINFSQNNYILNQQNILDPSTNISTNTFKSIKSLREYQLGVVFLDEYGRETPVISNASGTKRIPKEFADKVNRFSVQFSSDDYPETLTHFKFFIKETSTEYYNMAMDRWYSAGDGNIWLAFPSSDRNKIDIDTFLVLKKGSEQDTLVTEAARYKVLAIESEAPDFIKTSKRKTFSKPHNPGSPTTQIFDSGSDLPFIGVTNFEMKYSAFHGTSGQDLAETEDELYIEFGLLGTEQLSDRYKINSVTNSWKDTTATYDDEILSIELDRPLAADVSFISDDPSGTSPTLIKTGAIVNVYKYKVENLDKFDGRFFVKIYFDEVFRTNIETIKIGGGVRVASSKKVYSMKSDMVAKHTSGLGRFLTRSYGGSRDNGDWITPYQTTSNHWFPQGSDTSINAGGAADNSGQVQYGYYAVDEFSANALYFRRYREKLYKPKQGVDYGVDQANYNDAVHLNGGPDDNNGGNTANGGYGFRALVHLEADGKLNGKNIDLEPHVGYKGRYWKDSPDWWKEFGYNTKQLSASFRYGGQIGGPGGSQTRGLTSMWETQGIAANVQGNLYGTAVQRWYIEGAVFNKGYQSDIDSARDTEVWFIDGGPTVGHPYSSGGLRWNGGNHYDGNVVGDGLSVSGSSWGMKLSFGGIIGVPNDSIPGYAGQNPVETFWNIGDWNSPIDGPNTYYTDGATKKFVNLLNTGQYFKWREDPDKTREYLISGEVREQGNMRHSDGPDLYPKGYDNGIESTHKFINDGSTGAQTGMQVPSTAAGGVPPDDNDDLRSMAKSLSFNLTKYYRLKGVTPQLGWDPTADGIIPGGQEINLEAVDSAGDSGTLIRTSSGEICSGENAEDLAVYVREINTVDPTNPANILTLHEGMALTSYTKNNGVVDTPSSVVWVVREIIKLQKTSTTDAPITYFKLLLGGYLSPLTQLQHDSIFGNFPLNGSDITFKQVGMNGYSDNSEFNINTISRFGDFNDVGAITAVGYNIDFVEEIQPTEILSENPAIWETEPKDATELDIYYEASGSVPSQITEDTIASALPIGTNFLFGSDAYTIIGYEGPQILITGTGVLIPSYVSAPGRGAGPYAAHFFRPDDLVITTNILKIIVLTPVGVNNMYQLAVETNLMDNKFLLPWHNCYTFKNGVESNRIRDNFNLPFISNGVKASTTLEQEYKEERRKYGLIYSGIYNSTSGINNLNQFIAGEKITKDVNPIYGSIQKLYSRDSDLVTLCEDKILRIQANKDALFNADGNSNVIATDRVLGQTIPFSGEYGISTNPESFAAESYRAYFTDKVRGAVMRLSKDGLTPISNAGMKDWFRDNLKNTNRILGSYDDRTDEYNVALNFENRNSLIDIILPLSNTGGSGGSIKTKYAGYDKNLVLSFSEHVGGWVSFKSFTDMQFGISLANQYYTIESGRLYLHNRFENVRNTFYNIFTPSTLDVVLNSDPSAVKVFKTLNYEGSQSKVNKFTEESLIIPLQPTTAYNDQEYYNLYSKDGWHVKSIVTNKEEGYVNEFLEKEGKWFNGISKVIDIESVADTADFTFQGIGNIDGVRMIETGPTGPTGTTGTGASGTTGTGIEDDFDRGGGLVISDVENVEDVEEEEEASNDFGPSI